ncbi:MAG: 50S ribosomal protein L13 [Candidatus Pacebacteria bacterium]|nr:50S ribosomal protein L13 [Candidatus Paceibacterota bacterium]NUQ57475.1 50S ribosomal protein L13 [Candidatus Paceibacter sp.]
MKEYTIDAKNRSLGRVASEAASILRGKNDPGIKENRAPEIVLNVVNLDQVKITGQKTKQKNYSRYSGYPGGLSYLGMEKALKEKGVEYVFRKAVLGMLPKNKLQRVMINNLVVKNA